MEHVNPQAHKIKKTEFAGVGMFIQLLGVILCFTIVGAIIGIPLFFVGSAKATVYKCSHCMNKIDKESKICPVCSSVFIKKKKTPIGLVRSLKAYEK